MDFVNRLKQYMETANIAISQFADTCNIPRPTLSQILNGRNKKISDELITKIHLAYPNLSVLWLMFGEGDMVVDKNIQFSVPKNTVYDDNVSTKVSVNQSDGGLFDRDGRMSHDSLEKSDGDKMPWNAEESSFDEFKSIKSKSLDAININEHVAAKPYPMAIESEGTDSFIDFGINASFTQQPEVMYADSTSAGRATHSPSDSSQRGPAEHETSRPQEQQPLSNLEGTSCRRSINLQTEPHKQITNIVVFYSDNSFQSFSPSV